MPEQTTETIKTAVAIWCYNPAKNSVSVQSIDVESEFSPASTVEAAMKEIPSEILLDVLNQGIRALATREARAKVVLPEGAIRKSAALRLAQPERTKKKYASIENRRDQTFAIVADLCKRPGGLEFLRMTSADLADEDGEE